MNLKPKSRNVSLLLTVLLGPIGLFYASVWGGILLTIIAIVSAPTIVGPIVCWILAIAIGDHAAHKHNLAVDDMRKLMAGRG